MGFWCDVVYAIGGYLPFKGDNLKKLFRHISSAKVKFHKRRWLSVSDEAVDLVKSLLVVNTNERLTATQALAHRWMQQDNTALAQRDLSNARKAMCKFNPRLKLRGAVYSVIAINRLLDSSSGSVGDVVDEVIADGASVASDAETVDTEAEAMNAAGRATGFKNCAPMRQMDLNERIRTHRHKASELNTVESSSSDSNNSFVDM